MSPRPHIGSTGSVKLVPMPFPDETLYGFVSRMHLFMGGVFGRETSDALFSHAGAALHQDFPHSLESFSLRMEGTLGSALQIAQQMTVAPYFLRFKTEDLRKEAYAALAGDTISRLKHHLGLPAAPCRARLPIRFCAECLKEDRDQHGVTYWRRSHQLPGSLFCSHHDQLLSETAHRHDRRRLTTLMLPEESLAGPGRITPPDLKTADMLRRLSGINDAILDLELPTPYRAAQMQTTYRHGLKAMGLLTPGGLIRATDYLDYLHQRYQGLRKIEPFSWAFSKPHEQTLLRVVRKPRTDFHPIYHLVTIDALFQGWAAFESAYTWEEAMDPAETSAKVKPQLEIPRDIAVFLDALREAGPGANVTALARQFGVQLATALRWAGRVGYTDIKRRPKSVHHDLKASIKTALRRGDSQRDVARQYGLSKATVDRICNEEPSLHSDWIRARKEQLRREYRKRFLSYRQQHPGANRVALRNPGSGYSWLSRNDAKWLNKNLPPVQQPVPRAAGARRAVVDWDERDRQCLQVLLDLSGALSFENHERIKPGTILRKLPRLPFSPRLELLPKSRKYVDELVQFYAKRRRDRKQYGFYDESLVAHPSVQYDPH